MRICAALVGNLTATKKFRHISDNYYIKYISLTADERKGVIVNYRVET